MDKWTWGGKGFDGTITKMTWWTGKDWIEVPVQTAEPVKKEPETIKVALYDNFDKAISIALKLMDVEPSTVHDVLENLDGNWWVVRYL